MMRKINEITAYICMKGAQGAPGDIYNNNGD